MESHINFSLVLSNTLLAERNLPLLSPNEGSIYVSSSFSRLRRGATRSRVPTAFPTSFEMSVRRGTIPPAT